MDEIGLFWKKMPFRKHIAKEETRASAFKAQKNRVILAPR